VDSEVRGAPLPERIVDKGLLSDRVVIDIMVKKYTGHLPLYRQSVMLEREAGVEISLATMGSYVMRSTKPLISFSACRDAADHTFTPPQNTALAAFCGLFLRWRSCFFKNDAGISHFLTIISSSGDELICKVLKIKIGGEGVPWQRSAFSCRQSAKTAPLVLVHVLIVRRQRVIFGMLPKFC
jgi:hypothetical protein